MSRKITHVDFKKKKRTKEFVVKPERDKNEIFKNERLKLGKFRRDRKWEIPPGPECRSDEDLRALAHYIGPYSGDDTGRAMVKIFNHTMTCERCDAIVFKTIMDHHMQSFIK